jgi:5-methylcytosine-specific restriction enzyme A
MRSFSDFCAYLGCPLTNTRWSWSALSPNGRRAVFTIWSDEVENRQYVLYPPTERRPREIPTEADSRLGAVEIQRIAAFAVQDPTIEAIGILSLAKDPKAETRERESYDDRTVFRLRIEHDGERYVAHLVERPSVEFIQKAFSGL